MDVLPHGGGSRVRLPPARYAWPAALASYATASYVAGSIRHRREGRSGYRLDDPVDVASGDFLRACEALTGAPISHGNTLEILINGDRIFPAMLDVVRRAERTISFLSYVYWEGEIAHEMAEALAERARAGVEVCVLLDAVGSLKMDRGLLRTMSDAGVRVHRFRPVKPYAARRLNHRTHRKLLVADGKVGMTGGVGIAREWTGDAQDPDHWRDTHLLVRGPVVRGLHGAFAESWLEATGELLCGEDHLPALEPVDDGGPMQLVRSRAGVGDSNAEALMYLAIASARESVDLTAAYFAPRPAFVAALCETRKRDVRVRILVPGRHIDKQLVRIAGRAVYAELIDCGIEVHEYCPTMLHAKTLVVDGAWATVGSVNFDNRSFERNDEATLCVQSRDVARELTEQFERDLDASELIDPERWARRGPLARASEAATRLVRREL